MSDTINITPESHPDTWATLQPSSDRQPFEFVSDVFFVVKRYPKPFNGNLPSIESIHNSYEAAERACELENLGADYSTYTICIFKDGQFVDRFNRPLEYRDYP